MFLNQACKIYLFTMPTDMRKGFDGLSTIISMIGTAWDPVKNDF